MGFESIFGINKDNNFSWRSPTSLFSAFMFIDIITLIVEALNHVLLNIMTDIPNLSPKSIQNVLSESIQHLFNNLLLISISIIILKYQKLKIITVKIVLISLLFGFICSFLFRADNTFFIDLINAFFSTFILLFSWKIFVERLGKRKLSLAIGVLISNILAILILLIQLTYKGTNHNSFFSFALTYIIGNTLIFWIGLQVFDKIFKIKKLSC